MESAPLPTGPRVEFLSRTSTVTNSKDSLLILSLLTLLQADESQMAGVSTSKTFTFTSISGLNPLECALKRSLLEPEFRDVHLYAFSRRTILSDGTSKIDHPLSVVAISSVLQETQYFSKLFTSGFVESDSISTTGTPIREYALDDEYDYDSDSDLDIFEVREEESVITSDEPNNSANSFGVRVEVEGNISVSTESGTSSTKKVVHRGSTNYREILLPSIAHRTLLALVFYLYTGKYNFLPLRSAGVADRQLALLTGGDAAAPGCSPKSMFRLAELYGITQLQDHAYNTIVAGLTPVNIVKEAFSPFFARYERLREHAVSYLAQNYLDPKIQTSLHDALDKVVLGQLPHAGDLLRSLLGLRMAATIPEGPTPTVLSWASVQASADANNNRAVGKAGAQKVAERDSETSSESCGPSTSSAFQREGSRVGKRGEGRGGRGGR
ncbi:hypothetical protein C8Q79DRAFT_954819 [Trametes meyenii]|nr:hypothetical protein C8Q79DRAFT_954819 [Trametes meyenii]